MLGFKDEIIRFSEPKTKDFFPERFSNEIYFSNVNNDFDLTYTSSFSIKYVINGFEKYKVGKIPFNVKQNQYLIVNDEQTVKNQGANAKALSIFLDKYVINNIVDNLNLNEERLLDDPYTIRNENINFFETIYPANDLLGNHLNYFYRQSVCNKNFNVNEEIYYKLGLAFVKSQLNVSQKINNIKSIRYSTRRELFKRAMFAKTYIEDNSDNTFSLDLLSSICFLSKFHLIRVFKAVYNITPYNYYLNLKVEKSKYYLRKTGLSITEIAGISGFNDIYSYSKRFKLYTGMTPMEFRIKKY